MAKSLITEIIESEIDTVLADDIDFKGVLKFSKSLMIKGRFDGEIDAEGHLFLGPDAFVKANIKVNKLTSYGKIEGNVYAKERVELSKDSVLNGDIVTPDLVIESGCIFNGNCKMSNVEKNLNQFKTQKNEQQTPIQNNKKK